MSIFESAGRTIYRLGFEISPIILTGGIAANIPGGMLPIIAITEGANFVTGLLSGGGELDLDNFFAHYRPMPGGTLAENQIGMYPFANQAVAANAIIAQPLRISLYMVCPVRHAGGHAAKLVTLMALQRVLAQHNAAGGLYTIATPSMIYTSCVLLSLKDASGGESKQAQHAFVWDFLQPLVTLADAQQAQNGSMSRMTNGLPTDGSTSGPNGAAGATPALVPSSTNLTGAAADGMAGPNAGADSSFVYVAPTVSPVTSAPL